MDAGMGDVGAFDGSFSDVPMQESDAGMPTLDANLPDAGAADSGADAGAADSGVADAGAADSGDAGSAPDLGDGRVVVVTGTCSQRISNLRSVGSGCRSTSTSDFGGMFTAEVTFTEVDGEWFATLSDPMPVDSPARTPSFPLDQREPNMILTENAGGYVGGQIADTTCAGYCAGPIPTHYRANIRISADNDISAGYSATFPSEAHPLGVCWAQEGVSLCSFTGRL